MGAFRMKKYLVSLRHDHGDAVLRVTARNKDAAILIVCESERCPERAITGIIAEKKKK